MAIVSLSTLFYIILFYSIPVYRGWEDAKRQQAIYAAMRKGEKTLATQGDSEISGIMWADVGGGGGFGGI